MRKKYFGTFMCAAVLIAALIGGCGSETAVQTDAPAQESQAVSTEAQKIQEETTPVVETEAAETEAAELDTEAVDTEEYIDNPAAVGGEGDTNGFYDDAGTWVTVYKNSNGDWVDESGMVYVFGDDGVTDQNGTFYPY